MKSAIPLLALMAAVPAAAEPTPAEVQKIMQRDFHPRGQATMERLAQDGVQRVCTEAHDKPPAEMANALQADQLKTVVFPQMIRPAAAGAVGFNVSLTPAQRCSRLPRSLQRRMHQR